MAVNALREQSSQSTEKVFVILEYFANQRLPVRLQDVADCLKMPQTTLLRYFNVMIKGNYLYQDEHTKRYALTWKVCKFGHLMRSNLSIRSIVSPYLNELSNSLNLGVCVVALEGYESVYVDLVEDPSSIKNTLQRIGKRAPLHTTGSGKVMLSTFSDYEFEEYVKEKGLIRMTENTLTDKEQLKDELAVIRARGYAQDKEECELNIQCISVPVYDYTDGLVAAISVFGNVDKTSDEFMTGEVLHQLRQTSQEVSRRFGYDNN